MFFRFCSVEIVQIGIYDDFYPLVISTSLLSVNKTNILESLCAFPTQFLETSFSMGTVFWHSELRCCVQQPISHIRAQGWLLVVLCLIQLPAKAHEKAVDDGVGTQAPTIHMGNSLQQLLSLQPFDTFEGVISAWFSLPPPLSGCQINT